nr:Est-824 [synthetic construct]
MRWSAARTRDTLAGNDRAGEEVSVTGDRLTVFPTPRPGPRPTVLVLPGGGYHHHGEHEGQPIAEWLTGLGLHAVVLRYPVAPQRHPAPVQAAEAAVRWIRTGDHHLEVDRTSVGVVGFSAGGHLAATLCTTAEPPDRPDFAVLGYPVTSFHHDAHEGAVESLLGPQAPADERRRLSAEEHVHPSVPPTFLWHTADDASVPVAHSLRYTDSLARAGVDVELHVYPHGRHGLGLAIGEPVVGAWTEACVAWLRSRGWALAAALEHHHHHH